MSGGGARLTLASPEALGFRPRVLWTKCCLCQQDKPRAKDDLVCPAKNPNPSARNKGYETLAAGLAQLRESGHGRYKLSHHVTVNSLDEGLGFLTTLIKHRAVYHKTCIAAHTGARLQKLLGSLGNDTADAPAESEPGEAAVPDTSDEPVKQRTTRSREPTIQVKEAVCFLCGGPETWKQPLFNCATHNMYGNVMRCAKTLNDTRLLALVATDGDLVAQEAKYHALCLTKYYNKARRQDVNEDEYAGRDNVACEGLAFADLLLYMQEKLVSLGNSCVFKVADLQIMYQERLTQLLGIESADQQMEHSTRFREKILAHFPELTAELSGRAYILKTHGANVFNNLESEDQDDDALALNRFVRKMRKSIIASKVQFEGDFQPGCEESCIPSSLLAFINMTLYGTAVVQHCRATRPALTICQLIMANVSQTVPKGEIVRMKRDREPPLLMYTALSSYGRGRDRRTIDRMHEYGLSVSSTRVMEVTSQLCRLVVSRAEEEGVVCPAVLKRNLFTVAALDNIDFKPGSTTSEGEFHGTGMSIIQFPGSYQGLPSEKRQFWTHFPDVKKTGERGVPDLPESYSTVKEYMLPTKQPSCPESSSEVTNRMISGVPGATCGFVRTESEWLNHVHTNLLEEGCNVDEGELNVSWAAYHASKQTVTHEPAITALMPLLHQKSASVSTIRHGMEVISKITKHVNGNQTPVICVDQPLYALAKTIQWNWPDQFAKYVVMLGPFHIEQSFLKVIGQIMTSSGWCEVMANSGVTTLGSAEALLKVTHVTKSRMAHQVTAAALYSLVQDSFNLEKMDDDMLVCDWVSLHANEKEPTFLFWVTVLELEVLVLTFVSSIRQGDFTLFKACIREMLPWYFVTDHQNYARWLTIELNSLEELGQTAPDIHQQFQAGNFVVRKTRRAYSALAVDQAHEQENAKVKAKGGAVGLTQDASSLRRFTIGGPEISRLLKQFEGEDEDFDEPAPHHEQYSSFQDKFLAKCAALKESFVVSGNPFQNHSGELVSLDSHAGMEQARVDKFVGMEKQGRKMYEDFVRERLQCKEKSVYAKIPRANVTIFSMKKRPTLPSAISDLKGEVQLFSRLFIVSLSRNLDMDTFFSYENQSHPPALSLNGEMRSGDKSHLALILEKLIDPCQPHHCQGIVIDGAVLVHNLRPMPGLKTFKEYFQRQISRHVLSMVETLQSARVDFVWDLYQQDSTKMSTRNARGTGTRRQGLPTSGKLPSNWEDYLKNSSNKKELFTFLAEQCIRGFEQLHIVTNVADRICSSVPRISQLNGVSCGSREEADGRVILHVRDMIRAGFTSVLVYSTDTDVLTLCISFVPKFLGLGLRKLWVLYGAGEKKRFIAAHRIAEALGNDKAKALRGFHAFTGCDSVSFFSSKGKRTAWKAWADNLYTEAFLALSQYSSELPSTEVQKMLEAFTVAMYTGGSTDIEGVNEARKYMFATQNKPLVSIPPTSAALYEHILRAAYQAGQVWGCADETDPTIASPDQWGWKIGAGGILRPHWTSQPDIWAACRELDRCGCKSDCSTMRCKCRRNMLPCTLNCGKCAGKCSNTSGGVADAATGEEGDDDVDGDLAEIVA